MLAAACSGESPVRVRPPNGPDAGCSRLHDALPDDVDGRNRRATTPSSARTAAWGDPAIVLRCGVGRPAGLTPTSELIVVNGVSWFLAEPNPPYVFTSQGDGSTYVEVRVPPSVPRAAATAPLTDLAAAMKKALPRR